MYSRFYYGHRLIEYNDTPAALKLPEGAVIKVYLADKKTFNEHHARVAEEKENYEKHKDYWKNLNKY